MEILKVIIVDDHPLVCQGYEIFLNNWCATDSEKKIKVTTVHTLEEGQNKVSECTSAFDLLILDIRMPECPSQKLFSGEDFGLKVRKIAPATKIMVITSLLDNYRLYNVFKNVNPEALLIKTDLDDKIFIIAVETVLSGKPYYSKTFCRLLRKQFGDNYVLDQKDRELLFLLSKGAKTKDLPQKIHLSLAAIEKRKRRLKEHFKLEAPSVLGLIHAAREKGFL